MKKIYLLNIIFLCSSFGWAQIYFNSKDSLYYTDSTTNEICDGVLGFKDTIWTVKNSLIETYHLNDSVVYVFDRGYIKSKTKYDLKYKYQIHKYVYSDNKIVDSLYEFLTRRYLSEDDINYTEYIEKVSIIDGLRNGVSYHYSKDEPNLILELCSYKNDIRHGYFVIFKKNGLPLKEYFLNNGIKDGFERIYYEDIPQLSYEANYENGLTIGLLRNWWRNGNIQRETKYVNGMSIETSKGYVENGELGFIQYYENNKLVRTELYKEELPSLFKNEFMISSDYNKAEIIKKY
jgi:antitoxin component YwqK of YwqJK toxin-antitoxin module